MNIQKKKKARRIRRKKHIKKDILGTNERPRLTVSKSASHFYAQLINDDEGVTLVSASSLDKGVRDQIKEDMNKMQISKVVGEALAKRALEANIKSVSFDRNGYLYHGRIKTFADAARGAGLEF